MGYTYTSSMSITLPFNHMLVLQIEHSGMRRKKDINYSQENIKRFICQIIAVFHLSLVLSSLYGDSRLYLHMATADYQHNRILCVSWRSVHLKRMMEDIFLLKKLKKLKRNCEVLTNENESGAST